MCSTTLWQQMKRETNPAGYVCMCTPFTLPFRQHHKSIKTPVLSVNRPHPSTGGNKKTNPVDPVQPLTKAMMVSGPRSYTEHQVAATQNYVNRAKVNKTFSKCFFPVVTNSKVKNHLRVSSQHFSRNYLFIINLHTQEDRPSHNPHTRTHPLSNQCSPLQQTL